MYCHSFPSLGKVTHRHMHKRWKTLLVQAKLSTKPQVCSCSYRTIKTTTPDTCSHISTNDLLSRVISILTLNSKCYGALKVPTMKSEPHEWKPPQWFIYKGYGALLLNAWGYLMPGSVARQEI